MFTETNDPVFFKNAVRKEKWREMMKQEIEYIEANETWELCDLTSRFQDYWSQMNLQDKVE